MQGSGDGSKLASPASHLAPPRLVRRHEMQSMSKPRQPNTQVSNCPHLALPSLARCRMSRVHIDSSAASSSSSSASLSLPLLAPACGWLSCWQAYSCSTF